MEATSPTDVETEFTAKIGDVSRSENVMLKRGANKVSLTLDVENPKLWWPSAGKPAFFVWANAWGTRGEFDDNSITLYPGEPRTITFAPKIPGLSLDAFKRSFSVVHLRETYR